MNIEQQLRELLDKPEWTAEESRIVLDYLEKGNIPELGSLLKERFKKGLLNVAPENQETAARILEAIHGQINSPIKTMPAVHGRILRLKWWMAAATILLMVGATYYLLFFNKAQKEIAQTQEQRFKNDIAPGSNKAILTLGNGQKIILDSAHNGTLAQQGNTNIVKTDSGKLAYDITDEKPKSTEVVYNVLTTPNGGQHQLTLSDGTQVWLNAASSIKFPTSFVGKERVVEITGEAYFEVKHNGKQPFFVKAGNETIEDIGTHFNVNAYGDEASIKTTLLEGAVKVNAVDLKPGQQAQGNNEGIKVIDGANLEETMAWKNGQFKFNDATIESIMRQMSRWYDVEISYDAKVSQHFIADIPRDVPASELLKLLELTDQVHFRIEGKKITVMK